MSLSISCSIIVDGFFGKENLVIFTMISISFIIPLIFKFDYILEEIVASLDFYKNI
jgi:hypothetical protein